MLSHVPDPDRSALSPFEFQEVNLGISSVNTGAIELVMKGGNQGFSLEHFRKAVENLQVSPESAESHPSLFESPLYKGVRTLFSSTGSSPSGLSIIQLCHILPQLLDAVPEQADRRILVLKAALDHVRPDCIFESTCIQPSITVDATCLVVSVALLGIAAQGSSEFDPRQCIIGTWIRWAHMHREHFDKDPRRAILDRLIEFARGNSRLQAGVSELHRNWESYIEQADSLYDEFSQVEFVNRQDSDGALQWVLAEVGSELLAALGMPQATKSDDYAEHEEHGSADTLDVKNNIEQGPDPRQELLVYYPGLQLSEMIHRAVAFLADEPEWTSPLRSFESGGKFEHFPSTLCTTALSAGARWGVSNVTALGEEILENNLRSLTLAGFTRWHLLIATSAISNLLKQIDARGVDLDTNGLCAILGELFENRTNLTKGLQTRLACREPFSDPQFNALATWFDSISFIHRTISQAAPWPVTVEFRDEQDDMMRLTREFPRRYGADTHSTRGSHSTHDARLLRISGLPGSVSWHAFPEIGWKDISSIQHQSFYGICPISAYVYSAVLNIAKERKVPPNTLLGIDYEKFSACLQKLDPGNSIRQRLFLELMLDVDRGAAKKGVALFLVPRNYDVRG